MIQGSAQFGGLGTDRIQRFFFFLRLRLPLRWPVKRINIIGIMLSERQHEMRVPLRDGVHVVRRSRASARH